VKSIQPFFSIIIPTYNRSSIVKNVIFRILNQSFIDFELIVVDDGSEDDTTKQLMPYFEDPRFQYIYQSNRGVSAARNHAASLAKGEYILFLDSDDHPSTSILADFHERINQDSNIELVFSQMEHDGKIKGLKINRHVFGLPVSVIPGTYCIKRTIFLRSGGFDESLSHSENWELIVRIGHLNIITSAQIGILKKITLYYTARYTREKLLRNKENKIASYSSLFFKHRRGTVYPRFMVASFAQTAANNYAGLGRFSSAILWTLKSIQAYPFTLTNYYKPLFIYIKRRLIDYPKSI